MSSMDKKLSICGSKLTERGVILSFWGLGDNLIMGVDLG